VKTSNELKDFLLDKMSMTENYQPVIIRELLQRQGIASKDELSKSLMLENQVLLAYWKGRLMTWPKKLLQSTK